MIYNPRYYAQGTDSVSAELTPKEAVLNRNAAELMGRHNIAAANLIGNHLAQRGIDLPSMIQSAPTQAFAGAQSPQQMAAPPPQQMQMQPPPMQATPQTFPPQQQMPPQAIAPTQGFQTGESEVPPPFGTPEYKQWLINKIQSGTYNYTYGPGSPRATAADMRQTTGARDNPLQTGDIALPQRDYNLFTPQERQQLRIADTSWVTTGKPTPTGSVERYFGSAADLTGLPQQQSQKVPYAPTDAAGGSSGDLTAQAEYAAGQGSQAATQTDENSPWRSVMTASQQFGEAAQRQAQAGENTAESRMSAAISNVPTSNPLLAQLGGDPMGPLRQAIALSMPNSNVSPFSNLFDTEGGQQ